MTILFEATAPRGWHIVCLEKDFDNHVCLYRPWMADQSYKDEAKATIESPLLGIYSDKDYPDRQIYYTFRDKPPRYFKVVVEFNNEGGLLVAAYPTHKMKAEEYLIWPTSNR